MSDADKDDTDVARERPRTASEVYRTNAAAERDAAARTDLPNRKKMYERSAEAWDEKAEFAESTVEKRLVNEAVKALRPPSPDPAKRRRER